MSSLADHLKPPFFAAIMDSGVTAASHPVPSQAMAALATRQHGFLGLETAESDDGRPVTVSYWHDQAAIDAWLDAGAQMMADGQAAASVLRACEMRVTRVGERLNGDGHIHGIVFADDGPSAWTYS